MSNSLVVSTVLVASGSAEAKRVLVSKQPPTMKPIIGGFILGLGLFGVAALDEHLGATFCALVIVASLLTNGA